jgi:hypothetical protein
MMESLAPWFGQTVTLRLIIGELRVPLRGIILNESAYAVRMRVGGGWDIDVYKSLIVAVDQDNGATTGKHQFSS